MDLLRWALLLPAIPNARLETVGGSHILPATYPSELAGLIDAHVEASVG
jgi:hypothetical protein